MNNVCAFLATLLISTTLVNAQWVKTSGPCGSLIKCFVEIGPYVYAGGVDGVHRSSNDGSTWEAMNDGLEKSQGVRAIVRLGDTLIVGTEANGVYRSTNGGITWSEANTGILDVADVNRMRVNDIYVHQGNMYVLMEFNAVFISTNSGISWNDIGPKYPDVIFGQLELVPAFSALVLSLGDSQYVVSTNDGVTWAQLQNPVPGSYPTEIKVCNGQLLMHGRLLLQGRQVETIFSTTDLGNSWTHSVVNAPNGCRLIWSTIASDRDSGLLAVWQENSSVGCDLGCIMTGIYRSSNNGVDWGLVSFGLTGVVVNRLQLHTDSHGHMFAGTDVGIFRSLDSGVRWMNVSDGLPDLRIVGLATDKAGTLFAVGLVANKGAGFARSTNSIFRSLDNGAHWNYVSAGLPYGFVRAFFTDSIGGLFVGVGAFGLFQSVDGGLTWNANREGLPSAKGEVQVDYGYAGDSGNLLISINEYPKGTSNNMSYRSTNSGKTWERNTLFWGECATHDRAGYMYSGMRGITGVSRSTDSGATWKLLGDGLGQRLQNVAALTCDERGTVFAVNDNGYKSYVSYTSDHGVNWTSTTISGSDSGYTSIIVVDSILFVDSQKDVYRSTDRGKSWTTFTGDLPPYGTNRDHVIRPLRFALNADYLFAGTMASGVWRTARSGLTTSIDRSSDVGRGQCLRLYPDPLAEGASISYSVPSTTHVSLVAYNSVGETVATLVNGEQLPGTQYVHLDASLLPSGSYYCRLQCGSLCESIRFTVAR